MCIITTALSIDLVFTQPCPYIDIIMVCTHTYTPTYLHTSPCVQVMSLPHAEGTLWHARFGHLTGYGAGYYGYLYDRAFASHIWQKLFAQEPLNPKSGEIVWKKLLIHGGNLVSQ